MSLWRNYTEGALRSRDKNDLSHLRNGCHSVLGARGNAGLLREKVKVKLGKVPSALLRVGERWHRAGEVVTKAGLPSTQTNGVGHAWVEPYTMEQPWHTR